MRIVHLAGRTLPPAMAVNGVVAAGEMVGIAPPEPLIVPTTIAVVAWMLAGAVHGTRPCLACADELPLDGSAEAERKQNRLRVCHAVSSWLNRKRMLLLIVAMVIGIVAPKALGYPAISSGVLVAMVAISAPLMACTQTHAQLRPWCPWCRHRGDDDESQVGAPDLSPGHDCPCKPRAEQRPVTRARRPAARRPAGPAGGVKIRTCVRRRSGRPGGDRGRR